MIQITIYKNSSDNYIGFKSLGHAGYADSGHDIVCAAVSVLVINTVNSIEEFTEDKIEIKTDEKKGLIEFRFTEHISERATLLMNSLELGLQGIEQDYNDGYIRIQIKEV
ncbi:ribosomal-processing cysteine protease Prp [Konateibacter massiliensis]|uniref:ribosomal-processing cysteine protease Prp n=1 Tax=Konateibacter massiliensis TaxID=2002841 RepID=UPI000C15B8C9|nr:ribosomal-processing cysteine protease Prp [Konateibacter massiliensis]